MSHRLCWEKLLSSKRVPFPRPSESRTDKDKDKDKVVKDPDERSPFEQDYDRIVFSAPFRRLARKTQVHPMASNDHIHNRLTHSIEVASVGRSFAVRVAKIAIERSDLKPENLPDITWILQSACLIHDLGNPPFGHAGEEVVREWSQEHEALLFPESQFSSEEERQACRSDWLHFEGNAQGFRFSARADNSVSGYLRLTYATLGAAIKYPWPSNDSRAEQKRKHNIYSTELELFREMADNLGLNIGSNQWCRHPLSFLTEAADDICYRIIDLEDAVEMGICEYDKVHELFLRICKNPANDWMPLPQLRGQAIRSLMNQTWQVFEQDFDAIMNGERMDDLKSSLDSECTGQLQEVSEIYDSIFSHRKKLVTELGAYHVLGRILNAFVLTINSIADSQSYNEIHFRSKRTIELTWGRKHVEENLTQSYRWWLSQVMDFVSGMTDDYATRLSREIGGYAADLES